MFQLRHDSLVTGQWPWAANRRSPAAVTGWSVRPEPRLSDVKGEDQTLVS